MASSICYCDLCGPNGALQARSTISIHSKAQEMRSKMDNDDLRMVGLVMQRLAHAVTLLVNIPSTEKRSCADRSNCGIR